MPAPEPMKKCDSDCNQNVTKHMLTWWQYLLFQIWWACRTPWVVTQDSSSSAVRYDQCISVKLRDVMTQNDIPLKDLLGVQYLWDFNLAICQISCTWPVKSLNTVLYFFKKWKQKQIWKWCNEQNMTKMSFFAAAPSTDPSSKEETLLIIYDKTILHA